jgi:hypothetical protein
MLVGFSVVIAVTLGGSDGGGELQIAPRSDWVRVYPLLAGMVLLGPLSIAVSYVLGLRSWGWYPLVFLSFGIHITSTWMAKSTIALLRTIAPMATLDTPAPVYGFRMFWRDFYVDSRARPSLARR